MPSSTSFALLNAMIDSARALRAYRLSGARFTSEFAPETVDLIQFALRHDLDVGDPAPTAIASSHQNTRKAGPLADEGFPRECHYDRSPISRTISSFHQQMAPACSFPDYQAILHEVLATVPRPARPLGPRSVHKPESRTVPSPVEESVTTTAPRFAQTIQPLDPSHDCDPLHSPHNSPDAPQALAVSAHDTSLAAAPLFTTSPSSSIGPVLPPGVSRTVSPQSARHQSTSQDIRAALKNPPGAPWSSHPARTRHAPPPGSYLL